MPTLSPQRLELLESLASQSDPRTVDELADLTGLHANTVRNHLDGLVECELVARHSVRSGQRGRPSWRYQVVAERMSGAPEYVALAISLAGQIAELSDHPREIAQSAGAQWAAQIPGNGDTTSDLVDLLADLGFGPEGEGENIRLVRCPLLSAARQNPDVVCGVHEGLIRARLGGSEHGWLESFAGPGYCMWHGSGRA